MNAPSILSRSRFLVCAGCLALAAASASALRVQEGSEEEVQHEQRLPLDPDEAQLRAVIDLVRADVQTEKATIIATSMAFTEDEAFEFWPLYREYSLALVKLFDVRLDLIEKHIANFEHMTDDQARELAKDVFGLDARRLELKREWFERFADVISAKRTAQFFQIENQINAAIDLRVAASLPLIK